MERFVEMKVNVMEINCVEEKKECEREGKKSRKQKPGTKFCTAGHHTHPVTRGD